MNKLTKPIIFLVLLSFLFSCSQETPPPSFYYWKTNAKLSNSEHVALKELGVKTLYVRFFDVDKANDSIIPLGVISNLDQMPPNLRIVPVIFITNRTFINISKKDLNALPGKVFRKINSLLTTTGKTIDEIQIDCDWSESTRANYFSFLKEIKNLNSGKILSATIRFHQVKYPLRTGIPPVDKGVLMAYNIGNIKDKKTENSIYNNSDAVKYVEYIGKYPLNIDIALPIFSWQAQYRNGKLIDIIEKESAIMKPDSFPVSFSKDSNYIKINSSFLHEGRYFMKGDELKNELVSDEELQAEATLITDYLKDDKKHNVLFFDLDEYNLTQHNYESLKKIMEIIH